MEADCHSVITPVTSQTDLLFFFPGTEVDSRHPSMISGDSKSDIVQTEGAVRHI